MLPMTLLLLLCIFPLLWVYSAVYIKLLPFYKHYILTWYHITWHHHCTEMGLVSIIYIRPINLIATS